MTSHAILTVYRKNLEQCIREIDAFNDESLLWQTVPGVTNTAGNLALHLAGNLLYFIGAELGGSGYVRDRDAEFATKGLPKAHVIQQLKNALTSVEKAITGLSPEDLDKTYPLDRFGEGETTGYVLMYLLSHFNYHLGQINYLRRILSK